MTDITPNTFQCFNAYVDRALELVTDSELRILIYATRHIMGWQDKIKKRQGFISLTMFENGYTTESGVYYGGCGLGRGAIIAACKSLVEFKLLAKVGEPTEDGQKWELTTADIQWEKLEKRAEEKQEKKNAQTGKASIALANKRSGTSNDTGEGVSSNDTMQGSSNDTMQGSSNDTESNPSSNPSSNLLAPSAETKTDAVQQAEKVIEDIGDKPIPPEKKPRKAHPNEPYRNALLKCWNLTPDTVTSSGDRTYWIAAADLAKIIFPLDWIADYHKWCVDKKWDNFSVMAMGKHGGEYKAERELKESKSHGSSHPALSGVKLVTA